MIKWNFYDKLNFEKQCWIFFGNESLFVCDNSKKYYYDKVFLTTILFFGFI